MKFFKNLFSSVSLGFILFIAQPAFSADVVPEGSQTLNIKSGKITFVMDAPIEKIKGEGQIVGDKINLVNNDLKTVTGTVKADLSTFKTMTFDDPDKNSAQTGHMLNWFEIGSDVDAPTREKFKTATLSIKHVNSVSQTQAGSLLNIDADLLMHGITKTYPITVLVSKTAKGYHVTTQKPFLISLVDYDIRPRDLAGKILQKGLDALGQKVAKEAQVSVELTVE